MLTDYTGSVSGPANQPVSRAFSPEELLALAACATLRVYKAGSVIFEKGDEGTSVHFIEAGVVKLYQRSEDDRDMVLGLLKPGEFFGELSAIDGLPRSASALALRQTATLEVTGQDFSRLLERHPAAASRVCAVVAARLRRFYELVVDAAFQENPARVAKRPVELAEGFE